MFRKYCRFASRPGKLETLEKLGNSIFPEKSGNFENIGTNPGILIIRKKMCWYKSVSYFILFLVKHVSFFLIIWLKQLQHEIFRQIHVEKRVTTLYWIIFWVPNSKKRWKKPNKIYYKSVGAYLFYLKTFHLSVAPLFLIQSPYYSQVLKKFTLHSVDTEPLGMVFRTNRVPDRQINIKFIRRWH